MPLCDDQRTNVADFGNDQRSRVGEVIGVANVKQVAATIRIPHGGDEVVALADRVLRVFTLALCCSHLDNPIGFSVFRMLAKVALWINIAKVIVFESHDKIVMPSLATSGFQKLTTL